MKILFVFISFFVFNSELLNSARELYKEASVDVTKVEVLNNLLKSITLEDKAPLIAYKGAGLALKAKAVKVVKDKKKLFVEGVSLVEAAIAKEPQSLEVRFIRLTIQENTPSFLGYKRNLEEDKKFILTNVKLINSKSLRHSIKIYVKEHSKLFSESEREIIFSISNN